MTALSAFLGCWPLWSPAYAHGDHEAKHDGIMSRARLSAQCTYRAAKRRGGFTPFLGNAKPGA